MLVHRSIKDSGLTLTQIAEDSGLSFAALEAWVSAKRNPRPDSVRQLADGLKKRAATLLKIAAELDATSEREG